MNIHHVERCRCVQREAGKSTDCRRETIFFPRQKKPCARPKINFTSYTCVNLVSLPSLSWWEKLFRRTARINQYVESWCSLCGLGQRWSQCERPLGLMMCTEPAEACKSAAGITFSAASIPLWPHRSLCHRNLCAPVSGWGASAASPQWTKSEFLPWFFCAFFPL